MAPLGPAQSAGRPTPSCALGQHPFCAAAYDSTSACAMCRLQVNAAMHLDTRLAATCLLSMPSLCCCMAKVVGIAPLVNAALFLSHRGRACTEDLLLQWQSYSPVCTLHCQASLPAAHLRGSIGCRGCGRWPLTTSCRSTPKLPGRYGCCKCTTAVLLFGSNLEQHSDIIKAGTFDA